MADTRSLFEISFFSQKKLHLGKSKPEPKAREVHCLLRAGACVERCGLLGTPLCSAAFAGHTEVMRVLLDSRANIEGRTAHGATPLCIATGTLRPKHAMKVAAVLLRAGAIVDAPNKVGRTALWEACRRGHVRVVDLLLRAGARTSMRDRRGKTPFHAASGRKPILRLLFKAKWSRAPHVKRAAAGEKVASVPDWGACIPDKRRTRRMMRRRIGSSSSNSGSGNRSIGKRNRRDGAGAGVGAVVA